MDPDPEADDCQNLVSSSLSTDISVVKLSSRSVQLFYVKLLTDRQTDRQTNAGHYITSLTKVIKDISSVRPSDITISGGLKGKTAQH